MASPSVRGRGGGHSSTTAAGPPSPSIISEQQPSSSVAPPSPQQRRRQLRYYNAPSKPTFNYKDILNHVTPASPPSPPKSNNPPSIYNYLTGKQPSPSSATSPSYSRPSPPSYSQQLSQQQSQSQSRPSLYNLRPSYPYLPDSAKGTCTQTRTAENWETPTTSIGECCNTHFSWDAGSCLEKHEELTKSKQEEKKDDGGDGDGDEQEKLEDTMFGRNSLFPWLPSHSHKTCLNTRPPEKWEKTSSTLNDCCSSNYSWDAETCLTNYQKYVVDQFDSGIYQHYDWLPSPQHETCVHDRSPKEWETPYPKLEECCAHYYPWEAERCINAFIRLAESGELAHPEIKGPKAQKEVVHPYHANHADGTCYNDRPLTSGETGYNGLKKCCAQNFRHVIKSCQELGGEAEEEASQSGQVVVPYVPVWSTNTCVKNPVAEEWEEQFDSLDQCCSAHFDWNLNTCLGLQSEGGGDGMIVETDDYFSDATGNSKPPQTYWHPLWSEGHCVTNHDVDPPTYMKNDPDNEMQRTWMECCEVNFALYDETFDTCVEISESMAPPTRPPALDTSTSSSGSIVNGKLTHYYYPIYTKDYCELNAHDAPQYMQKDPMAYFTQSAGECCREHFPGAKKACVQSSPKLPDEEEPERTSDVAIETEENPARYKYYYYPNFSQEACLKNVELEAPTYMMDSPDDFFFTLIEDCCSYSFEMEYMDCVQNSKLAQIELPFGEGASIKDDFGPAILLRFVGRLYFRNVFIPSSTPANMKIVRDAMLNSVKVSLEKPKYRVVEMSGMHFDGIDLMGLDDVLSYGWRRRLVDGVEVPVEEWHLPQDLALLAMEEVDLQKEDFSMEEGGRRRLQRMQVFRFSLGMSIQCNRRCLDDPKAAARKNSLDIIYSFDDAIYDNTLFRILTKDMESMGFPGPFMSANLEEGVLQYEDWSMDGALTQPPTTSASPTEYPTTKPTKRPTPSPTQRPVPTDSPTDKPLPYYPDLASGTCYNDGRQSPFQVNLFDNLEECCQFPWLHRTDCLTLAGWTAEPTQKPTTRPTRSRTNRPTPYPTPFATTPIPTDWYYGQFFPSTPTTVPPVTTELPTYEPTPDPTKKPTPKPVRFDSGIPGQTDWPTFSPTTEAPTTKFPTTDPTVSPTDTPTGSPTETVILEGSTCLGLGWHIDRDNLDGCTDNDVIDEGWKSEQNKNKFFYPNSRKCCDAFFAGKKCKVYNYGCGTTKPWEPPPPPPLPESSTIGCVGTQGKGKHGWHMDRARNDGCSNDENIAGAWLNPNLSSRMFHDSAEACCNEFFPGRECKVYGVGCSGSEIPGSGGDTCSGNGWHLDRETNTGCTNDNNIVASWTNPNMIGRMFHSSSQACCEMFFRGRSCDTYDCASGPRSGGPPQAAPTSHQGSCGTNGWHIDQTVGSGCTNDDNYPESWLNPNQKSRMFTSTAKACCEQFHRGKDCEITECQNTPGASAPSPTPASGSCGTHGWHIDRFASGAACTNNDDVPESWLHPNQKSRMFTSTAQACCEQFHRGKDCEITDCQSGSSGSAPSSTPASGSCGTHGWHIDRSASGAGCTNDNNIPGSWLHPNQKGRMFTSTAQACCEQFHRGKDCEITDCQSGTSGSAPSSTPASGSCGANGWHLDRASGSGCTNDDNIPDSWLHPNQKSRMFAPSAQACCEQFFKGKDCSMTDCNGGGSGGVGPEPVPAPAPAPEPTPPTESSSCGTLGWHIDRSSGTGCTNDDNIPDSWLHPGQKGMMFVSSGQACCNKFFKGKDCKVTDCNGGGPAPAPAPEPTSPTESSSCGTHGWHIDRSSGTGCTNDDNIPDSWLQPGPSMFVSSGQACCDTFFKGKDCKMTDCNGGGPEPTPPTPKPVQHTPMPVQSTPMPVQPTPKPVQPTPMPVPEPPTTPCTTHGWHVHRLNNDGCTNDVDIVQAWLSPGLKERMFRPTLEACCQQFFFGRDCKPYPDICQVSGPSPATPGPTPPVASSVDSFSEDFESGNLGLFTTSSDLPWTISNEFGRKSVKNSVTARGQHSKLNLSLDFPSDGILFYDLRHDVFMPWAVLQVKRDEDVVDGFHGHTGEPEFEKQKIIVEKGVHNLVWDVLTKDVAVPPTPRGTGTVWIDNVRFEKSLRLDWEDEKIDNKVVSFGGIGRWRIDDSMPGGPSSKSGVAIHSPKGLLPGEDATMKIKRNVSAEGTVFFESHSGLGTVSFYIDGELKWSENRPGKGTQEVEFLVPAGEHTFEWKYEPPKHANMPMAMVWLDNIMIPL